MLKKIKALIQAVFIRLGYKVVPAVDEDGMDKLSRWMKEQKFKSILDIGANEGQFATKIRKLFPDAFIHSFEPLPHVYEKLKENFTADQNFAAYNFALGREKGR